MLRNDRRKLLIAQGPSNLTGHLGIHYAGWETVHRMPSRIGSLARLLVRPVSASFDTAHAEVAVAPTKAAAELTNTTLLFAPRHSF